MLIPFLAGNFLGRAKTYNLRKIQRVVPYGVEDEVLQPVDDAEKLVP